MKSNHSFDFPDSLDSLPRKHDYFIGYDSDGCVFDTMELKHRTCFGPAAISRFDLSQVADAAMETWTFVNLYSRARGCNRFIALKLFFELLKKNPQVIESEVQVPDMTDLERWIRSRPQLGNDSLEREWNQSASNTLRLVLEWSRDVNQLVANTIGDVEPIEGVLQALQAAKGRADQIVISQATTHTLEHEWGGCGLTSLVSFLAGQEHGTKAEHIRLATAGKGYRPGTILMVGDAPGDQQAAEANQALFYPIIPGQEVASWRRFVDESLERFFNMTFDGEYQIALLAEFEAALPPFPT